MVIMITCSFKTLFFSIYKKTADSVPSSGGRADCSAEILTLTDFIQAWMVVSGL